MDQKSSPASPPPTPPPAPPPSPPAGVIYLEWTKCSAAWRGTTSVDISADGYLRKEYRGARLSSQGWKDIKADGDAAPKGALVIDVVEVASSRQDTDSSPFFAVDNVVAPAELAANPEVVFCGLEPGPDESTPPALGMMKKTRIKVPGSAG